MLRAVVIMLAGATIFALAGVVFSRMKIEPLPELFGPMLGMVCYVSAVGMLLGTVTMFIPGGEDRPRRRPRRRRRYRDDW